MVKRRWVHVVALAAGLALAACGPSMSEKMNESIEQRLLEAKREGMSPEEIELLRTRLAEEKALVERHVTRAAMRR